VDAYRANGRDIDMLDALLRLDLRVDPRRRRSRSRRLVLNASAGRAVGCLTGSRAALTMRLGLSTRRRPGATVCVEAGARCAIGLVAVEARSRASFVRHGGRAVLDVGRGESQAASQAEIQTNALCRARQRQLGPKRPCAVCRRMPDVGAEHGISRQWTDSGDMSPLSPTSAVARPSPPLHLPIASAEAD
jgi:hypothetical protein